jgi:hypothetical protein
VATDLPTTTSHVTTATLVCTAADGSTVVLSLGAGTLRLRAVADVLHPMTLDRFDRPTGPWHVEVDAPGYLDVAGPGDDAASFLDRNSDGEIR